MLIRTNFVRPESGQDFHHITYKFDSTMELDVLYVRNLLYAYLGLTRNMYFKVGTSLRELIEVCGAKPTKDYKRTDMYRFIKEALESLIKDKFIEPLEKTISSYTLNEYIRIQVIEENFYLSVRGNESNDASNEPFFSISAEEFSKIQSLNRCDLPKLFYVYCYIKTRIRHRSPNTVPQMAPKMYFESVESMAKKFGASYATAVKYISNLCQIGLLRKGKLTTAIRKGAAPNVYVLNEEGWEMELKNAILYLDGKRKNDGSLKGA